MLKEPKFEPRPQGETNLPEQENPSEAAGEESSAAEEALSEQDLANRPEDKESNENPDVGFAAELRETPKRGFFRKLKILAGALALAGLFLFSPQESVAPELSAEALGAERIWFTKEYQSELYKKILKQIEERGGVVSSPQLPEQTYRPADLAWFARKVAYESPRPFYNEPEVIFGRKFIEKNPKLAEKYYEKAGMAIKATVRLSPEPGATGSGVMIKGKKDRLILTNAHVCGDKKHFMVSLSNGNAVFAELIAIDNADDIAVLKIQAAPGELFESTESLEIEEEPDGQFGETLAAVGNPSGFPFAVGIARRAPFFEYNSEEETPSEGSIFYEPDERFRHLELYMSRQYENPSETKSLDTSEGGGKISAPAITKKTYIKGEAIGGMSGGPVVSLEREGKPRLLGLTRVRYEDQGKTNMLGGAVSSEIITKFLRINNLI